jgi:hypothetical protein
MAATGTRTARADDGLLARLDRLSVRALPRRYLVIIGIRGDGAVIAGSFLAAFALGLYLQVAYPFTAESLSDPGPGPPAST